MGDQLGLVLGSCLYLTPVYIPILFMYLTTICVYSSMSYCIYYSYSVNLWCLLRTCCLDTHITLCIHLPDAGPSASYHRWSIEHIAVYIGDEGEHLTFWDYYCLLQLGWPVFRLFETSQLLYMLLVHFLNLYSSFIFVVALYLWLPRYGRDHLCIYQFQFYFTVIILLLLVLI